MGYTSVNVERYPELNNTRTLKFLKNYQQILVQQFFPQKKIEPPFQEKVWQKLLGIDEN